jgi:hypothetical protein
MLDPAACVAMMTMRRARPRLGAKAFRQMPAPPNTSPTMCDGIFASPERTEPFPGWLAGFVGRGCPSARSTGHWHMVELTGDIVNLFTLPAGSIPVPFDSSEKVWLRARNQLDFRLETAAR